MLSCLVFTAWRSVYYMILAVSFPAWPELSPEDVQPGGRWAIGLISGSAGLPGAVLVATVAVLW